MSLIVYEAQTPNPKGSYKKDTTMKSQTRATSATQLSFAELDLNTDISALSNESVCWNIAPIYDLQSPSNYKDIVESTEPTQIHISALDGHIELPMDDVHIEWNVASIRDIQIGLVKDAATLISKSYARPDNLENLFAWIFDTDSEDVFGISECAKTLNQTTFELQRRFYRCLKRTFNELGSNKVSPKKRTFYCKLMKKARMLLARNANYVVCTEVEAEVAIMESMYRPQTH